MQSEKNESSRVMGELKPPFRKEKSSGGSPRVVYLKKLSPQNFC